MDVPEILMEKRGVIECNFIFSCYKDMTLLKEYSNVVNGEDIITPDGQFYMGILKGLEKTGVQTADNMSIYTFLEDKPNLKKGFEERGGTSTISEIMSLISVDNIDSYYDELTKSNMLIRLHNAGFNVTKEFDKFKEMNADELYSYFEYQLSNIAIGKIEKIKSEDLTTDYERYIDEWDRGADVGFKIGSGMLNYQLLGIHKKNLLLHGAGIGQGKTSSAIAWYILPTIETQDVCIVANEQGVSEWRQMILATVLFNKIGKVEGFNRHKMITGHYTFEQKEKMKEAAEWLEKQPGKIHFIETQDYNIGTINKILSKYSSLGISLFIIDTLKPMDDASDRAWAEFSEVAKTLFLQAKKLDVAVVATVQLSPDAMSRRYLDLTCIGKSRSIAETATQCVLFRSLTEEEKDKVKAFKYEGKVKQIIDLDPNKEYIMVFTPKNRFGAVEPQILMERNMGFNSYRDVGWTNCEYDKFRNR